MQGASHTHDQCNVHSKHPGIARAARLQRGVRCLGALCVRCRRQSSDRDFLFKRPSLHHSRHARLDRRTDILAGIGDVTRQRTCGHRQRRRKVHRRLRAAHAAGEVAVGRADADFCGLQPAEGIHRPAEARAAAAGAHRAAGIHQDVFDALFVGVFLHAAQVQALHVGMHFGAARHDEGLHLHVISLEDVGRKDHVRDLAAGAGADVRAVELHIAAIVRGITVVGRVRLGD